MAAYTDLGEKGHGIKIALWWEKWHIIGGKSWIDFSESSLACVNIVYKRKAHCFLEKYQVDKSKSRRLSFVSLV